jgi:hypothetical protein
MPSALPPASVARRQLIKAAMAGGVVTGPLGASAAAQAASPIASEGPKMTTHDVHRIAAVLYGATVSPADAETIAKTAEGALANLHYLTLLKSDGVAPPFGYAALVEEASRP